MIPGCGTKTAGWRDRDGADAIPIPPPRGGSYSVTRTLISALRAGRRRELEGTFDHGDEGYGLWLDPSVADDPVYAEHWAGHRPVVVTVEAERIVITRAGEDGSSEESEPEED